MLCMCLRVKYLRTVVELLIQKVKGTMGNNLLVYNLPTQWQCYF